MSVNFALVVDANDAQRLRQSLEKTGNWDGSRRLKTVENGRIAIPLMSNNLNWEQIGCPDLSHDIIITDLPTSKKFRLKNPAEKLSTAVRCFAQKHRIHWSSKLERSVPTHWEKHGDLILLPETAFKHHELEKQVGAGFWQCVAQALGCRRLARKFTVCSDGFRTPRVSLLLGADGWVQQVDNGIRYTYDITKCMFSAGNISEKLRVSRFNCRGETVVDLYAGIGYFTLPYLVHAGAHVVHACEWNPAAVDALEKNLKLNSVQDRCVVHFGDNRKVCPQGIADRVNLGLIPSSEAGWSVACAALKPDSGGVLHIHANVTSKLGRPETGKPLPSQQADDNVESTSTVMIDHISHGDDKMTCSVNWHYSDTVEEVDMVNKNTVKTSCGQDDFLKTNVSGILQTLDVYKETNVEETSKSNSLSQPVIQSDNGKNLSMTEMAKDFEFGKETNVEEMGKCNSLSQTALQSDTARDIKTNGRSGASVQSDSVDQHLFGIVEPSDMASALPLYPNIATDGCPSQIASKIKLSHLSEGTDKEKICDDVTLGASSNARESWLHWAREVSEKMNLLLLRTHGEDWITRIVHIEHVKSYAPRVDHLVLDLDCRPAR